MSASPSVARSWLYWQLLDQLLLQDKNDSEKFDRYEDLRMEIGEVVIVVCMQKVSGDLLAKLKPRMEEWDVVNVFGGPTLINQIKRAATSTKTKVENEPRAKTPPPSQEKETVAQSEDSASVPAEIPATPLPAKEPEPLETIIPLKSGTSSEERRRSIVEFDFEKQGIPAGKVEARQFLEPCKAVATLQITRDLRSESTVHLRSLLSSIPKEIQEDMVKYKGQQDESGEAPEIESEKVEHYSVRLDSEIVDLDVDEALENVRSFREVVQKLKAARKKLFHLLIKSRCQFGSMEAAEAFFGLDDLSQKLHKRKELILDAMDLEGLEPPKEEPEENTKELEGFSWYNPEEPTAKKQKVQ